MTKPKRNKTPAAITVGAGAGSLTNEYLHLTTVPPENNAPNEELVNRESLIISLARDCGVLIIDGRTRQIPTAALVSELFVRLVDVTEQTLLLRRGEVTFQIGVIHDR